MSFYKYLMMKYKNNPNMKPWYGILLVITLVSFKLPPLIVFPLGFFIREFQNYNEWMANVRNVAHRQNGEMPRLPNVFLQFLSLILLILIWMTMSVILSMNSSVGEMMMKFIFFAFTLIPFALPFIIINRYKSEVHEKEVNESLQYSQEFKEKIVQQVRSIGLNQLQEFQSESEKHDVLGDGESHWNAPSRYVQNPVNLNKKLQLKPREFRPNVISFEGGTPKTMFDSEYMNQVIRANEEREEEAKVLLHADTGIFSAEEKTDRPPVQAILEANNALLDEAHYSDYKRRVKQYEKKLEKEQEIKHGHFWFGMVKVCPICGGKSKIHRGEKKICEFCGMELE